MTIASVRRHLYTAARLLGDLNALKRGRVVQRIMWRVVGRFIGRLLGRLLR
jgi:hypothetical protein